jgi:hypothetical protein
LPRRPIYRTNVIRSEEYEMDWGEVARAGLIGALLGAVLMVVVARVRRGSALETTSALPNPLADSPAVSATLAALAPELRSAGVLGWLVVMSGSERAAAEAVVSSLQPGLPAHGDFSVNRLVGSAAVRLSGRVNDGVAVVTAVERLDQPSPT